MRGDYELRYVLRRGEWLRTEWPGVLFYVGAGGVPLLLVGVIAILHSAWWALLLVPWWPLGGARAAKLLLALARGDAGFCLTVRPDGLIFVSQDGSEPVYGHWAGIADCGQTLLLWGGDGRHRLIIPKRALTSADVAALAERIGVDLANLRPGQEARLGRTPGTR